MQKPPRKGSIVHTVSVVSADDSNLKFFRFSLQRYVRTAANSSSVHARRPARRPITTAKWPSALLAARARRVCTGTEQRASKCLHATVCPTTSRTRTVPDGWRESAYTATVSTGRRSARKPANWRKPYVTNKARRWWTRIYRTAYAVAALRENRTACSKTKRKR